MKIGTSLKILADFETKFEQGWLPSILIEVKKINQLKKYEILKLFLLIC